MHSVIETNAYLAAAKDAGATEDELMQIVELLASDPATGAMMQGCGGVRKFRFAKPGRGKSGGYRVIHYYGGDDIPIFLLTMFGKSEKDNLSKDERNALANLTKRLRASLG